MPKPKQSWDTRAWLIGILGGAVGGSLAALSIYPVSQDWLNALPHFAPRGYSNGEMTSGTLNILVAFLLPGILSGIARRRTFFWGTLPLTLFLVARDVEDWAENGSHIIASNLLFSFVMVCVCLLVSSGPVSLIRWLRVRAARHHAARLASYQAQRMTVSVPQEGIWPPPPEYRE